MEIFYDPDLRNWDAVTEQELKRRGLQHGQVTVICKPKNAGSPVRIIFGKESIENGKINL